MRCVRWWGDVGVSTALWILFCWMWALAGAATAEVVRWQVEERNVLAEGRTFGSSGAYEKVRGRLHYALDPNDPANQAIVDLALAPRGQDGRVHFHGDAVLIQPVDAARRQGTVLLEIPNRGRRTLFQRFHASDTFPGRGSWLDEPLLLEQGFRLLWVGWQQDTPYDSEILSLQRIEAKVDEPGLLRSDAVFSDPAVVMPLAHRNHRPYGVSDPQDARNQLTVRESALGERQVISREAWRFARLDRQGKLVEDSFWVHLDGGFEVGKIYEVVYVARRPAVSGLGFAAVRDAASFFKRRGDDLSREISKSTAAQGGVRHKGSNNEVGAPKENLERPLLAFGASQGGRFLRDLVSQGFAVDEQGRQAFDGLWVHGAGAGGGSFNHRFAEPSRDGHAFASFLYPTDHPPFTGQEGLYTRWRKASKATDGPLPAKIMVTHTSYEYWGRGASLTHTTADGSRDAALDAHERMYLLAGTQHLFEPFPPRGSGTRFTANPNDSRYALRALLMAFDGWLRDGTSPPASDYPRIEDATLVMPSSLNFPDIPGVELPNHWYRPQRLDFGPRFLSQGIIDQQPPKVGAPWSVRVPQVDADGNERAGIRLPAIVVPVATYSGWNLRPREQGAEGEMADFRGAMFPFPRRSSQRPGSGDPRRSLTDRYEGRVAYLQKVEMACQDLVEKGLLLKQDVPVLTRRAATLWDSVISEQITLPR